MCKRLIERGNVKELFSGIIVLKKKDQIVYEKVAGYANWENKVPVTEKTLFNIASLNKPFTHELILQLQKEGKISLNNPISAYISNFPQEIGDKVTIQHLIDMKSGMGDYLQYPEFREIADRKVSIGELMDIIKTKPLHFEPGTSSSYSNSGYVVLGAIVEEITGKSFYDNLKQRVFHPLQMKDIYYDPKEFRNHPDAATGTLVNYDGKKKSEQVYISPTPAGGMFATINELIKFHEAKAAGMLPSGQGPSSHMLSGGTSTWNANIGMLNDGYSLVIVSNFGGIANELAMRIFAIISGKKYEEVPFPPAYRMYGLIKEKGLSYIKDNLKDISVEFRQPHNEYFLNWFGYAFMRGGEIDLAIELFKINTELFPLEPNVWESLAEGFLQKGEKKLAIKYYQKVLELDPQNTDAKIKIGKIKKG